MSAPIRILLSESASARLRSAGDCFAVVGRASYPDDLRRMVLHLVPAPLARAAAACRVATGEARAVKPRTKSPK